MPTPDDLVNQHGRNVTVMRVSSFDVTRDGAKNITREYEHTQAILSKPSEDDTQRLEGRIDAGSITATLLTSVDVEAERDGGRDRIALGHIDPSTATDVDSYTVQEDVTDTHPMVGIEKATYMCERYSGRDTLSEDADVFVAADSEYDKTAFDVGLESAFVG